MKFNLLGRVKPLCFSGADCTPTVIDIRNCHVYFRDGFKGTAEVHTNATIGSNSIDVNTVISNTDFPVGGVANQVIVGTRIVITSDPDQVYTVTSASNTSNTWTLGISPDLVAAATAADTVDLLPQLVEITKMGNGTISYTEKKKYDYVLNRGQLDTVRLGDDQPLEAKIEFEYDEVTASNGEPITPVDAIKGTNGANTFITASANACEPFATQIVIENRLPCGNCDDEIISFDEFRYEDLAFDIKAGTIACTGKCNLTEVTPYRGTLLAWELSQYE